jgi:hypothetical protein
MFYNGEFAEADPGDQDYLSRLPPTRKSLSAFLSDLAKLIGALAVVVGLIVVVSQHFRSCRDSDSK